LNPAPLPHRIDDVVIILKFPLLLYQTITFLTTFLRKKCEGRLFQPLLPQLISAQDFAFRG
jgi:hypothetical protein